MCEFYPGYKSCCGIPQRLGLVFIAILAIVTGVLLNGAIKKAGINVGSIQDVKEVLKHTTTTTPKALAAVFPISEDNNNNLVEVETTTTKRRRTTTISTTTSLISTVEIIGEDAPIEITRFDDSDGEDPPSDSTPSTTPTTTTTTTTTTTRATTKELPRDGDVLGGLVHRVVHSVARAARLRGRGMLAEQAGLSAAPDGLVVRVDCDAVLVPVHFRLGLLRCRGQRVRQDDATNVIAICNTGLIWPEPSYFAN